LRPGMYPENQRLDRGGADPVAIRSPPKGASQQPAAAKGECQCGTQRPGEHHDDFAIKTTFDLGTTAGSPARPIGARSATGRAASSARDRSPAKGRRKRLGPPPSQGPGVIQARMGRSNCRQKSFATASAPAAPGTKNSCISELRHQPGSRGDSKRRILPAAALLPRNR